MADKQKQNPQITDTETEQDLAQVQQGDIPKKRKKGKKSDSIAKTEEELYMETLSKTDRKAYEKQKRAFRRAQWVDEYWIIIVLAVAVLVVICVLVAINYVRAFSKGSLVSLFHDIVAHLRALR